jgi:hypothetical protein
MSAHYVRPSDERFIRAVLRELTWKRLVFAHLLGLASHLLHFVDTLAPGTPLVPLTWHLSGLVIQEFTILSLLIGILAASEAVRRGARDWVAYPVALLLASAITGIGQWYVRHWLGFEVLVDLNSYTPAARRWGHMLYIGIDTFVYGAFVMLVFANWQRHIRYVRLMQDAELRRAELGREISRSRLATFNAHIEPAWLHTQLDRLRSLYDALNPAAEAELDLLVAQLRAKTASMATLT